MAVTVFTSEVVAEGSDCEYRCQFQGANAAESVLLPAAITSIKATLVGPDDAIINSRDEQEVKNANNGAIDSDGSFTLALGALDNPYVGTGTGKELHRLTLEVTYTRVGGGTGQLNHAVHFYVQPLEDA